MIFQKKQLVLVLLLAGLFGSSYSQEQEFEKQGFIIDKQLEATSVKHQYQSSTCWSFAALSFIESELLRTGKGEYDLSEIFVIRNTYMAKAEKYIRMHGKISFSGGGEANDVTWTIKTAGIMPESIYPGNDFAIEDFNFEAFDAALQDFVQDVVNSDQYIDPRWKDDFSNILDKYLGPVPQTFIWQGTEFTPVTFAAGLDLNMDDYILLGSYTHHPYYDKFVLEVPDNWSWGVVYNITTDEMIDLVNNTIKNGYSIVWAADNSEEGFSFRRGVAEINDTFMTGNPDRSLTLLRQQQFDNFKTQDDHGMHITGIAHDSHGKMFYLVKNSWGTGNLFMGYLFASEAYLRLKTISVMVHKDALSDDLKSKLNI